MTLRGKGSTIISTKGEHDMKVIVTDKCDRCKREAPKEIDHTDVEKLQEEEIQRIQNFTAIKRTVEECAGALPDLIVIFKGTVRTTNHVCDANCKTTIEHALEAVFKEIDPSQRAPRKTRTSSEVPVEGSTSSETPAAETHTSGGKHKAGTRK
jgi:hypothetical protein